jgi:non-canonical poly(A) RNA polymerase PAPD5/7
MDDDFVPFVVSSDEDLPPVREWDKGKGKARASDRDFEKDRGSGTKRKHDLLDDHAQQRRETTSRKAPWAAAVDWESCKNVPEM